MPNPIRTVVLVQGSAFRHLRCWSILLTIFTVSFEGDMSDAPVKQKTPAKRIVGTVPSTSDGLQFTLAPNADSVCPMTLTNRCNKAVAFKIKTNNTERYLVQPNQGVISTNGTAEIQIFCLARNVNEILQTSFHQMAEYQGSDKFLLQTRTIDASKMEELMKKAGTVDDMAQVAEELSQLFATTAENKRKIQHHKFQVGYDSDFWKQPVASPPANAVASVETIQEATIPVNQAEDPAKDSGEENVLHGNLAAGGGEATPEQASGNEMVRKEDAMNSPSLPEDTKVSASLSADNTKGSAGTTMRVSYDSDKMEKDLTALRKKYDELLKWTLKLTGDRDQLQKMTDKLVSMVFLVSLLLLHCVIMRLKHANTLIFFFPFFFLPARHKKIRSFALSRIQSETKF